MYSDFKERKILNIITFPGMLAGLAFNFLLSGQKGIINAGIGISLGFVFLFIPYILHGIGAGDVKFLMMCGAFAGKNGIIIVFLAGSVLAAVFSIFRVILNGGIKGIFIAGTSIINKEFLKQKSDELGKNNTVPYGIPYGIGAIIQMIVFIYFGKGIS